MLLLFPSTANRLPSPPPPCHLFPSSPSPSALTSTSASAQGDPVVQTRGGAGRQARGAAAQRPAEHGDGRARRPRLRPAPERERERGPLVVRERGQGREGQGLRRHVSPRRAGWADWVRWGGWAGGMDGEMEARFDVRERGHEHCCLWFALLCVLTWRGGGEGKERGGEERGGAWLCDFAFWSIPRYHCYVCGSFKCFHGRETGRGGAERGRGREEGEGGAGGRRTG